ncbi:MAG: hypothetical protein HYY35_07230 [Deltaproteobacteria bacterium]|nr:hypothetical protein [Deltaproteobacteria bacterium]
MRRLVLLCTLVGVIGCAPEPARPPAPPPAPQPLPDPFFVHRVEHAGETLGEIARWYTGKYGNWLILTKPVNADLEGCCAKLDIGREVKIPRHLAIRTEPMPAPKKKVVSRPTERRKAKSAETEPPNVIGEAPPPPDEFISEEPPPAPEEAPPAIIGPK